MGWSSKCWKIHSQRTLQVLWSPETRREESPLITRLRTVHIQELPKILSFFPLGVLVGKKIHESQIILFLFHFGMMIHFHTHNLRPGWRLHELPCEVPSSPSCIAVRDLPPGGNSNTPGWPETLDGGLEDDGFSCSFSSRKRWFFSGSRKNWQQKHMNVLMFGRLLPQFLFEFLYIFKGVFKICLTSFKGMHLVVSVFVHIVSKHCLHF